MSRTLSSTSPPSAYTLIELLDVMLVIALTGIIEEFVAHRFGRGPGIGAAAVTLIVCVIVLGLVYRWSWRRERKQLQELFFFQAEDGIRDYNVTGVQTCALPI